jgi:molybdenum cofactor cytidylyltransferase
VIAGLLLAAGRGARFGGDKMLAPLRGVPVVRWSAEALAPAVDALYVVTRTDASELARALDGLGARIVENPDAADGMASSIRRGVAALPDDWECVVIALGDQPLARTEVPRALIARFALGGVDAVAPAYRDGRGHPVLFGRALREALLALAGDSGARALLQSLGERLALVPAAGDGPIDVDTPEALRALEQREPRDEPPRE